MFSLSEIVAMNNKAPAEKNGVTVQQEHNRYMHGKAARIARNTRKRNK